MTEREILAELERVRRLLDGLKSGPADADRIENTERSLESLRSSLYESRAQSGALCHRPETATVRETVEAEDEE